MKRLTVLSFIIGLLSAPIPAQAQKLNPGATLQRQQQTSASLQRHNAIMTNRTIGLMHSLSGRR